MYGVVTITGEVKPLIPTKYPQVIVQSYRLGSIARSLWSLIFVSVNL